VPAAVVLRKTGLKEGLVGNALGVERVERPDVAELGLRAARSLGLEAPSTWISGSPPMEAPPCWK